MQVTAHFASDPPALTADLTGPAWQTAAVFPIDRTWRGDPAPPGLGTTARVLWTASHLWFAYECRFAELDIDSDYDPAIERVALWDRDVCEAFVRSAAEPRADSYKEFEVAPTGQWCDLVIHRPRVDVDWQWQSGMETAAAIDLASGVWRAVMRIPFTAFGVTPAAGDQWHVNLFRISRVRGERYFLAYAPTGTETPDFHRPECFVPLVFSGHDEPGAPRRATLPSSSERV